MNILFCRPDPFFCKFILTFKGKMAAIDQFHRYRVINNLLVQSKIATKEDMRNACELKLGKKPSLRTIENDIHYMQSEPPDGMGAPLDYSYTKHAYEYTKENWSMDGIPLHEDDLTNLVFAASVLSQYKDIIYFDLLQGTIQKIVNTSNLIKRENHKSEFFFIEIEKSPLIKGAQYLERIIDHINKKEVIKITYHAFNKEKNKDYILHPYYLKEFNDRWYMLAMDDTEDKIKTFGLDRIERMNDLPNRHYRQSHLDYKEHFKNVIGIMIPDERQPEEVVVAFTEFQSKYAMTQKIHHSQTLIPDITDKMDRLYFKYYLIPNFELTQKLLGWGANVEVISPEWYRDEVKNTVEELGRVYE